MLEIIVPDDGLLYKTKEGIPLLHIVYENGSTVVTAFSKNETSKIVLYCNEGESALFVASGQQNIELSSDGEFSKIRLTNERGNVTNQMWASENGGQVTLSNHEGKPLLDMGINSDGTGSFSIRNNDLESVISFFCIEENGILTVSDSNGEIIWTSN